MKLDLEETFLFYVRDEGVEEPVREYKAIPGRGFRFDFAWEDHRLLLECHGGVHSGGRHTRGYGFIKDREKMNLAQIHGWTILEVCREHIESGKAIEWVKEVLKRRECELYDNL